MKALVSAVTLFFALLNASFIGVVVAEMAESVPAGSVAALITVVIEAIAIRFVKKAIATGPGAGASQQGGHS